LGCVPMNSAVNGRYGIPEGDAPRRSASSATLFAGRRACVFRGGMRRVLSVVSGHEDAVFAHHDARTRGDAPGWVCELRALGGRDRGCCPRWGPFASWRVALSWLAWCWPVDRAGLPRCRTESLARALGVHGGDCRSDGDVGPSSLVPTCPRPCPCPCVHAVLVSRLALPLARSGPSGRSAIRRSCSRAVDLGRRAKLRVGGCGNVPSGIVWFGARGIGCRGTGHGVVGDRSRLDAQTFGRGSLCEGEAWPWTWPAGHRSCCLRCSSDGPAPPKLAPRHRCDSRRGSRLATK